jgi:hypothetical protein
VSVFDHIGNAKISCIIIIIITVVCHNIYVIVVLTLRSILLSVFLSNASVCFVITLLHYYSTVLDRASVHCAVLYSTDCTTRYCIVLYCDVLCHDVLYCTTVLHYTVLYDILSLHITLHHRVTSQHYL